MARVPGRNLLAQILSADSAAATSMNIRKGLPVLRIPHSCQSLDHRCAASPRCPRPAAGRPRTSPIRRCARHRASWREQLASEGGNTTLTGPHNDVVDAEGEHDPENVAVREPSARLLEPSACNIHGPARALAQLKRRDLPILDRSDRRSRRRRNLPTHRFVHPGSPPAAARPPERAHYPSQTTVFADLWADPDALSLRTQQESCSAQSGQR